MNIKMNDRNNYTPAFQAKMQLRGNISLLDNKQVQEMTKIIKDMGQATDIVDIALPEKVIRQKGVINIAGFVNGALEQVSEKFENNKVFEGIMSGLDKIKKVLPKKTLEIDGKSNIDNQLTPECLIKLIKSNQYVKKAIAGALTFNEGALIEAIENGLKRYSFEKPIIRKLIEQFIDNGIAGRVVDEIRSDERYSYRVASAVDRHLYYKCTCSGTHRVECHMPD